MFNRIFKFITQDIWQIPLDRTKRLRTFFLKTLRITIASLKGFNQDACTYKAAALSFYTLLALVPVVAIAFGIARGFGFDNLLEEQILDILSQQQEVAHQIIEFSRSLLKHAQGGVIAGLGIIFMLWTGIGLLSNFEEALNEIWQVKVPRTMGRKFSDYLAMIILCPIFLVASSSVSVYLSHEIGAVASSPTAGYFEILARILSYSVHLFPLFISWILFGFIYLLMPNTKVDFKAGMVAGMIAGTAFQIVQALYISFQLAITSYGAIYGSFAALPLFLLWLQISWLITFAGAEIAYHIQNTRFDGLYLPQKEAVAATGKEIIMWIVHRCVQSFCKGTGPVTVGEITHQLGIPITLARQFVRELENAGILVQVNKTSGEESYLPARDVQEISFKFILDAMEKQLEEKLLVNPLPELLHLSRSLQNYEDETKHLPSNQILSKI